MKYREVHDTSTDKLIFSLRLPTRVRQLADVTQQIGFAVEAGWERGEQKRTLDGSPRQGTYTDSYRSYHLGEWSQLLASFCKS